MIISEEKSCRITLPCERNPKPGARLLAGSNNNFEKHTGSLIMILKAVLRPCMTHECSLSAQLPIYQCNNCRASPDCEQENILGSVVYDTAKECEDRCRATGDQCEMADYNVKLGTCKIYTCTEVQEVYGYTAFRRSSNPGIITVLFSAVGNWSALTRSHV